MCHMLYAIAFSSRSPSGGASTNPPPAIPRSFCTPGSFVQLVPDSGGGEGEADGTGGRSEPERLMGRVLEQPGTLCNVLLVPYC